MRDDFNAIVSGWALHSGIGDLTERIEEAAQWTKDNGPLQPDEEATIKLMIEAQIARGGFDGLGDDYEREPVFTHCNVCGKRLREPEEDEMGMCAECANL
jgi:hypothetical protein